MGSGYQTRDYEIIDYELVKPDGFPRDVRGPECPMTPPGVGPDARLISFVGAAQTFGCYAPQPFPQRVSEQLGTRWHNFGVAGAGPEFFLRRPQFLEQAQKADLVVVQVMSGRSVSNSRFDTIGLEMLTDRQSGEKLGALPSYKKLLDELGPDDLAALMAETRDQWIAAYREIFEQISAPTVLLWFSEREHGYQPDPTSILGYMGKYPQFVQPDWVDAIKPLADRYVHCVSRRGFPQELRSRFTGKPVTVDVRKDMPGDTRAKNEYYPSPEMHEDATKLLVTACAELLNT